MTSYQITKLPPILDFLSFHKHHAETTRNDSELLDFLESKGKGKIQRHEGTLDWNSKGMGEFLEVTDKSVKAQKR